ncbi:MAG: hypothetical protein HKN43_11235 [Rhodothermales bacterium]|nr:hypothetical protein [Rhodothermales bacterium]
MIRPQNHIVVTLSILMLLFTAMDCRAQSIGSLEGTGIQAGIGFLPGVGIQVAYFDAKRMYVRDVVFYTHLQPGIFENSGSLQISGSLGAAVRIIGILETIGAMSPRLFDVHLGARIGPGLTFAFDESSLEKNQRFSLTLEPLARFVQEVGGRRYYMELGIVRPSLRFGLLFSL